MDNPIFCAETNRQETKHESVNNITLFIFVQNRKKGPFDGVAWNVVVALMLFTTGEDTSAALA